MSRRAALLILALSLVLALAGCANPSKKVTIADDRIIGAWISPEGAVNFYPDGTLSLEGAQGGVNAMNNQARYEMPKKDRIVIHFENRTRYYEVTFKGSKEHSVRETDKAGKIIDSKPIVYTRLP